MDFTLSDEQRMMQDSVREMLAAECTVPQLRKMVEAGQTRDEGRWKKLFELGLGGVLADEALGGLGLRELDFALVAEECGRALLPEPLVEQAGVTTPLLSCPGLSRVCTSVSLPETFKPRPDVDGRDKPGHDAEGVVGLLASAIAGETVIAIGHPANPFVTGADTADFLLLPHSDEIHLVARRDVELTHQPSIDPFRRLFRVDWSPNSATHIATDASLWSAAFERGTLFAAAQGLGIAERAIEISTSYAQERQQFGKPIGSYQAIKHALATVQVKIAFARPIVYAAAALFQDGPISQTRVSHAKLAALDAADLACRAAIQVHGAMGYSWETDVHFFLKRALALTGSWGDRSFHTRRVRRRLFETELPLGPDHTFQKGDHHAA